MADKSQKTRDTTTIADAAQAPVAIPEPLSAPAAAPAKPKSDKIALPLVLTVKATRKNERSRNIEIDCIIVDGHGESVQSLSLAVDGKLTNPEVETVLQEAITQLARKLFDAKRTEYVANDTPLSELVGLVFKGSVSR